MTSTIKVNNIQNQCGANIINESSNTITIGASGDTISLASGASQTGFGRTGTVDWDTTPKTSTFTAVAGKGYFVDTTGGAITVNLPAGSAGAQIALADYAGTWDTNNCTVSADGSEKIQGSTIDVTLSRDREAVQIIYVDSTQGWVVTSVADQGGAQATFISASGGTETTSGNFKIHTFTSSGTFTVSSLGNASGGGDTVSYVVVAGGAGGGSNGGGGGAGGYRESKVSGDPYTAGPPAASGGLTVSATGYPITVGAGGAGNTGGSSTRGSNGATSTFSTISSAGGGAGGSHDTPVQPGVAGGSGGGGGQADPGTYPNKAAGNTPPVSPPQGNPGGDGSKSSDQGTGGGGGATAAGTAALPATSDPTTAGVGGAGATSHITGSPVARAGGGGGAASAGPGAGGAGGGGSGTPNGAGNAATANTGGGGGGGKPYSNDGGSGGSGVVIIRYQYQN